ncbi:HotDog domain-containing protein [Lasiosphaeris hirsuta]|uniref:HotDog domain-containing protein n=1 Tax=Lasiosphaeris hirsuta TaxID=260670 RepID=A0AA40DU10_9PEZI|nr:HotDog domain-containing protein [Lasiosphaeris hirsuta]
MGDPAPAPPSDIPAAAAAASDAETLAHVVAYHTARCCASPIYEFLLGPATAPLIRFTHATKGLFLARLVLSARHLNSAGGLHGSVSATIVDWAGGLAIAAWDLRQATGVSVDINITYLSSVGLGDEVEIEGSAGRVGGSLAFTEVKIWKVEGGERGRIVVQGRHTKFVKAKK